MKTIPIENSQLADCVSASQQDRIVVTEAGVPVALIVGLRGLDAEQLSLCRDAPFWKQIAERRGQGTISREELERQLSANP